MVLEEKKTIAQAARKLIIKPSTAKLIIKKFRETGAYVDKKMPNYSRRKSREVTVKEEESLEVEVGNRVEEEII